MAHGLDVLETGASSGRPRPDGPADRVLDAINRIIVMLSPTALVLAGFVLTYSVVVRYFLRHSTDWQDEMSVFLIARRRLHVGRRPRSRRSAATSASRAIVGLLPDRVNRTRVVLVDAASLGVLRLFRLEVGHAAARGAGRRLLLQLDLGTAATWISYSLMTVGMILLAAQPSAAGHRRAWWSRFREQSFRA